MVDTRIAMGLLIPHPPRLEKQKLCRDPKMLKDMRGELCINSVAFSKGATHSALLGFPGH